jgi:hypothetical protein
MMINNSRVYQYIHQHFYFIVSFLLFILMMGILLPSCKKDDEPHPDPSDNLAIDSLVATKTDIKAWEEINITAYTRGKHITFKWSANHGSMAGKDSSMVKYWACTSCIGLNTVKCTVSNEFGTLYDTIMINVHK